MKKGVYTALGQECGEHLMYSLPDELPPDPERMPAASRAVYAAVDDKGAVCYVGSVFRPADPNGLASHISEYLHDLSKTEKWVGIYVFPLKTSASEPKVRQIAGNIAGWVLPYDRERWPLAS